MMKVSAWHKAQGDNVGFNVGKPDMIYASILFSKNRHLAEAWATLYPDTPLFVGGPGYEPTVRLPPEIECMPPDQNLYSSKYSIGRVTSGCPRKCYFCIVPKLEPDGIRYIQHPKHIWKRGTILRLLDDNILADKKAFDEICDFCKENDVTIRFEYLDARLLRKEHTLRLKELRHEGGYLHFSWDMTGDEKLIRKAFDILCDAGWRLSATQWLIYLHDEKSIPDAAYRFETIRSLGGEPFLMINNEGRTKKLRKIARRGCRPAIWRKMKTGEVFGMDCEDVGRPVLEEWGVE